MVLLGRARCLEFLLLMEGNKKPSGFKQIFCSGISVVERFFS